MQKGYSVGCTDIYHRMSVAIASIRLHEIGDFDFRIKQKTLSYVSGHFSGQILQIYVFFLTMQRSCRNIIPKYLKSKDKDVIQHKVCQEYEQIYYNSSLFPISLPFHFYIMQNYPLVILPFDPFWSILKYRRISFLFPNIHQPNFKNKDVYLTQK